MSLSFKETRDIVSRLFKRDRLAISRLVTLIEDHHPAAFKVLSQIYSKTGRIFKIGVTGFPGAGKSTLINRLARAFLDKKKKVGVVLVDPTSPITGGALLGDRIRMKDIQTEPDVYIRSMATRGGRGGLAQTSKYVVDVLDAAGWDVVLIETVGVGQLEIDIAHAAHITLVVLTPEAGDEVQAMKAGLMEVSNLFVVNKMDRDKEHFWLRRLKSALEVVSMDEGTPKPKVFAISALNREGIDELFAALWDEFKAHPSQLSKVRSTEGMHREVISIMEELFLGEVIHRNDLTRKLDHYWKDLIERRKSPYEVARILLKNYLK